LLPTGLPFRNHWYVGELPPFVGVAVKVTDVPAQKGLADGEIDTPTGSPDDTDIVMVLEVAGLPEAQEEFEVSTAYTWSPLDNKALV
jgi:hypothetical protein